jgi:hypothetical protein
MLALTLILLLTAHAPQIEYGSPEELKGLTKVFVDTGGDMKERGRIQHEIRKARIGVELLDSEDGAEIVLTFKAGKDHLTDGSIFGGGGIMTRRVNIGEGRVYVVRGGKSRLVMSYEGEEKHLWEKKPAKNFGRRFAKAYKEANGLK